MPKIFEWKGYKFFFYANEGEPLERCHIHVMKLLKGIKTQLGGDGMTSLHIEAKASKVWFDNENLCVALFDGRQLFVPLVYFPRLLNATPQQRIHYELSGGGTGIHWDEIDEDLSVPGLLMGNRDVTNYKNII